MHIVRGPWLSLLASFFWFAELNAAEPQKITGQVFIEDLQLQAWCWDAKGDNILAAIPKKSERYLIGSEIHAYSVQTGKAAAEATAKFGWRVVKLQYHQTLQSLVAATRTVPDEYVAHSLHSYFLQPGDPGTPTIYDVENLRDGRSFVTRRVIAQQHGRPIYAQTVNFQKDESGYEHEESMPEVSERAERELVVDAIADERATRHLDELARVGAAIVVGLGIFAWRQFPFRTHPAASTPPVHAPVGRRPQSTLAQSESTASAPEAKWPASLSISKYRASTPAISSRVMTSRARLGGKTMSVRDST